MTYEDNYEMFPSDCKLQAYIDILSTGNRQDRNIKFLEKVLDDNPGAVFRLDNEGLVQVKVPFPIGCCHNVTMGPYVPF